MPGILEYLNQKFKMKIVVLVNCRFFKKSLIHKVRFKLLVRIFRNAWYFCIHDILKWTISNWILQFTQLLKKFEIFLWKCYITIYSSNLCTNVITYVKCGIMKIISHKLLAMHFPKHSSSLKAVRQEVTNSVPVALVDLAIRSFPWFSSKLT